MTCFGAAAVTGLGAAAVTGLGAADVAVFGLVSVFDDVGGITGVAASATMRHNNSADAISIANAHARARLLYHAGPHGLPS